MGAPANARVAVVADADDRDAGYVGARLTELGMQRVDLDRDDLPPGVPDGTALVLLLGSERSAWDPAQAGVVERESQLVRRALDAGTPVLGICYGGQLLAHALGGEVGAAAVAEIGWHEVDSLDDRLCPPGPWAQFHSDAFTPPPGARVLGRSPSGCQGFAWHGSAARALGWQFHPEVTPTTFVSWVDRLEDYCRHHGADPASLREQARGRSDGATTRLVDAALHWLEVRLDQPAGAGGRTS